MPDPPLTSATATSPLAGITHGVTLVLVILLRAPLAVNVPLCAPAAILFVVAWNMSAVRHFARMVRRAPRADPRLLILHLRRVPFMDITGLQTWEEVIQKLAKRGVTVVLCEANARVRGKLEKAGLLALVGE